MTEVVSGIKEQFRDQVNDGFGKLMSSMTSAIGSSDNREGAMENVRSLGQIQDEINKKLTGAIVFIEKKRKKGRIHITLPGTHT